MESSPVVQHDKDEAALLAAAIASADAGRLISAAAVNAWIDSLDTDAELPAPTAPG